MKKGRYIVLGIMFLFICGLCIPIAGEAVTSEKAQETVSITEFYNNGVFGNGYEKACDGAVVTISDVEEMRIFLNCLLDTDWTNGISFRQEADIIFSDAVFEYDYENNRVFMKRDGIRLKYTYFLWDISVIYSLGLEKMCIEGKSGRDFLGQYDGQGYSINGVILVGNDSRYSGIFGHIAKKASIRRLKVKNVFLSNTYGTLCGLNEGTMEDCSAEQILGIGISVGGVGESNDGTMLRCRLEYGMLCSACPDYGCLGGIVAKNFDGEMSDCSVEHLLIQKTKQGAYCVDSSGLYAGGIAGYQTGGKIYNCSSFSAVTYSKMGEEKNIGGIVGYLKGDTNSEISNCISAGKFSGKVTGGIVGKISSVENIPEILLENNISLARVDGSIIGGVVGQLDAGQVMISYFYEPSKSLAVIGQGSEGNARDCHAVTKEQVYGEAFADVINANSTYSNTNMLLKALNNGAEDNSGFLKWKVGDMRYPVLISKLNEAPEGDYELGSEIEISFPYGLEASHSPSPDIPSDSTPSPSPNISPGSTPSPGATVPPSTQGNEDGKELAEKLVVKNLKVKLEAPRHVRLSWSRNRLAEEYHVLRSTKGSSGYNRIGRMSASKTTFLDTTAKKGQTYYYIVRGCVENAGSTVYGNSQKKKVQTVWYQAPSLRLSAGKTSDGKSYVQLGLSKYSGSYIEVYFKVDGKNYIKAPLKNKKIAYYNGKLRFSYKTKSLLYCKVRTYGVKKGKKQYSAFSKERKIRL